MRGKRRAAGERAVRLWVVWEKKRGERARVEAASFCRPGILLIGLAKKKKINEGVGGGHGLYTFHPLCSKLMKLAK